MPFSQVGSKNPDRDYRSVEKTITANTQHSVGMLPYIVLSLHSYGMQRLLGAIFSTERFIPNGMKLFILSATSAAALYRIYYLFCSN
jgi:hypothetical protein